MTKQRSRPKLTAMSKYEKRKAIRKIELILTANGLRLVRKTKWTALRKRVVMLFLDFLDFLVFLPWIVVALLFRSKKGSDPCKPQR